METPDFLLKEEAKEAPTQTELTELSSKVKAFRLAEKAVEELEASLALAKKKLSAIGGIEIPQILLKHGLSELRLASGEKVIIKSKMAVTVAEEKRQVFFDFLRERNEDDIIKINVAFSKMPKEKQDELFEFLNNYEFDYEADRGVHHKTMEAYFNRLLGIGKEDRVEGLKEGKYLREEDLAAFATCFPFHTTTIK